MMHAIMDVAVGALESPEEQRQYANFYANLTARIDRQLAPVVDCFYEEDGTPTPLGESTVIVRFSDHGELAISHGGLRQKAFNVYEETLRVPLIVSNPRLVPAGRVARIRPRSSTSSRRSPVSGSSRSRTSWRRPLTAAARPRRWPRPGRRALHVR